MSKFNMVLPRKNTRTFTSICSNYYSFVRVRKYDKAHDIILVDCNWWTWIKIRFWYWINDPDVIVAEE